MNLNEFQEQCEATSHPYKDAIDELLLPIKNHLTLSDNYTSSEELDLALVRLEEIRKLLRLSYVILGWAGEVGEVCNKFKKVVRDNKPVNTIVDETRDASWYQNLTWSELSVKAEDMALALREKLFGRKDRGTLHGSGDNR